MPRPSQKSRPKNQPVLQPFLLWEGRRTPRPLTQSAAHSKIERRASPSPSQNLPPLLPYKLSAHKNRPPHTQAHSTLHSTLLRFLVFYLGFKSVTMPKAAKGRSGKPEKKRAKKDPNAPKRGLSAYMFFANEQRENVREENPGVSFGQVGKILGERWKALSEKQRAPYEAKAAADKKRYEDEKQAYNAQADGDDDESS
ncbi:hypothetical protein VTI28DRAFT_2199 [Corynascus sepedonium]